jgi:hemoglobin
MQVRLLGRGILAGLVALALVTCLAVSDGAQQKPKTLYERLGGYDAIAVVTDDFIGRLVADKQITRFFTGASTDSKKRIRQLVVDQICAATGGPCIYIGRSMKASHEGLGITESDWQVSVGHLVAALDKFKVPQKEKDELLAAVSSLKPDIVAPAMSK